MPGVSVDLDLSQHAEGQSPSKSTDPALAASGSADPGAATCSHRLTGFAVALQKRATRQGCAFRSRERMLWLLLAVDLLLAESQKLGP